MATSASRQRTVKRGAQFPTSPEAGPNGNAYAGAQPMMDLDFLRGLIRAVDESGIDTLEIHRAGTRIRIAWWSGGQPRKKNHENISHPGSN